MSLQSSVNQGLYSLAISKAILAKRNRDNELNFKKQQKQDIERQKEKVTLYGHDIDVEQLNPKIRQQLNEVMKSNTLKMPSNMAKKDAKTLKDGN